MKAKIFEGDHAQFNIEMLTKIREEFFGANTKTLFKNMVTNKSIKTIICFVYNALTFIFEGEKVADETAPSDTVSQLKENTSTEITNPTPRA